MWVANKLTHEKHLVQYLARDDQNQQLLKTNNQTNQ